MKTRLYDLYVLKRDGSQKKLTGYPMTHRECCVMKSKFNPETQANILFVESPKPTRKRSASPFPLDSNQKAAKGVSSATGMPLPTGVYDALRKRQAEKAKRGKTKD